MTAEPVALPRDGKLRLGGREVHVTVRPAEGAPVILLGGCGVAVQSWDAVVAALADRYVARLDRPGLGGTPWPGTLPRLEEEVLTLQDLAAGVRTETGRPAVLVAHSMAGVHAEALIRRRPDLAAGLVLVESSVEFAPRQPGRGRGWVVAAGAARSAMGWRPVRALGEWSEKAMLSRQSRRHSAKELSGRRFRDPEAVASVLAEQAAYRAQVWDLARLREVTGWPGTPTVVLSAAEGSGPRWLETQEELARLLGGNHVVVERSRHMMMLDRPELIASVVRRLAPEDRRG